MPPCCTGAPSGSSSSCVAAKLVVVLPCGLDDMADLGGAIKYIHTEMLTEHYADPLRTTRKYGIDVLTRKRYKIKNTEALLKSPQQAMGEFGQFVTYDWGQATNPGQYAMFKDYGDFVGLQQGCGADMQCDVRWPSSVPYSWFSVGNWCPNLPWDKKGSKGAPNAGCLKGPDGNMVEGGLCPNGFDPINFIPTTEPTGTPGCVYSYGKSMVVDLDAMVGMTAEDCAGGVKCRDWLHFRHNCTDPKLRRMFLPTGEITNVDYCVEFDIHPKCDACQTAGCQALLKSGQEAYLGLPYWHGRCDPLANARRTEQAAAAFGIPGALNNHITVDPDLVATGADCPRSKGTSWACAPEIAGMAGPMCSREFNGACQPCFVPGTVQGPDPPPMPYCPLNIFTKGPYTDRLDFPIPKCKTNKASDGCCLYSNTCDGESDPNSASLDDDGYALVAARSNSNDMEVFLRRAAGGTVAAQAVSNTEAMRWAGYFGWENGPATRTLAQVLEETAVLAKTSSPPVIVTSQVQVVQIDNKCFELAVSWQPLDMPMMVGTTQGSAKACQEQCAGTDGCRHFSFWQSPGIASGLCHLHDISATVVEGSVGYTSGPNKCWEDIDDTSNLIDKGHKTYVSSDYACMDWGTLYEPALPGGTRMIPQGDGTNEQAIAQCQTWCVANFACEHFSISFPSRMCTLAGAGASIMVNQISTISGRAKCDEKDKQAFYRLFLDSPSLPSGHGRVSGVSMAVALVVGISFASLAVVKVFRTGSHSCRRTGVSGAASSASSRGLWPSVPIALVSVGSPTASEDSEVGRALISRHQDF
mmetsp:Transcript_81356/g.264014  ORF Transcript_81356/g.264014 Transcript_81356/m.264014 type:complete len:810 (-) Transcript_81356:34-2463(-)